MKKQKERIWNEINKTGNKKQTRERREKEKIEEDERGREKKMKESWETTKMQCSFEIAFAIFRSPLSMCYIVNSFNK